MEFQPNAIPLNRGIVLRQRHVGGNLLMEAIYPSRVELLNHWHAKANFCIVLDGTSTERYGAEIREFRPLTASFLPPEQLHSLNFHARPMRCFTIDVAREAIERSREYSLVTDASVHFHDDLLTETFLRLYREFREADEASVLAIEGMLFEMLALASRRQTTREDRSIPKWLKLARGLLHERFADQLSLSRIAAEVGVHPVHLAREFRKHYRCSLGEYLRQVRVEHASRQLLSSDDSSAVIASAAGFSDQSHFTRTFRRLRGITPGKFRASLKPNIF